MPKGLCKYCGSDEIKKEYSWYGKHGARQIGVETWCSECNRVLSSANEGQDDESEKEN